MIFIPTESILDRFNIKSNTSIKNGRKSIALGRVDEIEDDIFKNLEKAINGRLSADSINYELAISNIITKDFDSVANRDIRSLILYLVFESHLVNSAFGTEDRSKKVSEIGLTFADELKKGQNFDDLLLGVFALNRIYNNDSNFALTLCASIKNEQNLKIAIEAFIKYQQGNVTDAIKVLETAIRTDHTNIFFHLCINLKVYISIQDGRLPEFKSLLSELDNLKDKQDSHLAPIMQSNYLYLLSYTGGPIGDFEDKAIKHYENVSLYHASRELDLLDNLKNSAIGLASNEVYENIDTYGKDTLRFNNTPDAVGKKLSRFVFLHSFMGGYSGVVEGSKLLARIFFPLGGLYNDQSLYRESLRNAVSIGSANDIEKIIKAPAFIKNVEAISYFEKLILGNPYEGPAAIGISNLLKYMYRFYSKKIEPSIVRHLKNEMNKEFSFTSDFDHVRPALEALCFSCHTLPKEHGLDLYQAFAKLAITLPLNMIGVDAINKAILNIPEALISSDSESSKLLSDYYFNNLTKLLKMHHEMTLLSLSRLIRFSALHEEKNKLLDLLAQEIDQRKGSGSQNIFLYDIIRDLKNGLSADQVSEVTTIIFDKVLSSASPGYGVEGIGAFDSLVSTEIFDLMNAELKNKYISKLIESLFDSKFSFSNKIRVLSVLQSLSREIDKSYYSLVYDFVLKNRENLFASSRTEKISHFRASSFVSYRALLYACASFGTIKNPTIFSLDLLRLSVSTEAHVREIFIESVIRFINASNDCSSNLSLLHRCYELSFDVDPKVRGSAVSAIVELFDQIDDVLKQSYLLRVEEISNDNSEIARSYLAHSIGEYGANIPRALCASLKSKLENDMDFHVRKNVLRT